MAILPPNFKQRYFDSSGNPLSGGKLYTYIAGTTTPLVSYTDATETSQNTNPIILDADGECDLWLGGASAYKIRLTDASDVEQWTVDNVNQSSITSLASADYIENLGITCSVNSNALTINVKAADGTNPSVGNAVRVGFRSNSLSNGLPSLVTIQSPLSMTISSGSTLGHTSGVDLYVYVYLINNDGVAELAVSSTFYTEESAKSTSAEGGAGGADSLSTIYSIVGRTNKAIRLVGRLTSNQSTAGLWAAAPSEIQTGFSAGASVVNTSQIANLAVTTAKIDNLAVTTAKLADGSVTQAKRSALGQQVSASSGAFSTSSVTNVDVTNLSVTITTTGRPVYVFLTGDSAGSPNIGNTGTNARFFVLRDSTTVSYCDLSASGVPPSSVAAIDQPAAGTYVYKIQTRASGGSAVVNNTKLVAFEL